MIDISVIVTCYNEESFIGEAIQSVLDQTCFGQVKEIVIVDDGSTDNSQIVIQDYFQKSDKLKYLYQENQGLAVSRNTGLKEISGAYVAFLDGDDTWEPKKLERQLEFLRIYPDVGLLYTDTFAFDGNGKRRIYSRSYRYNDSNVLQRLFIMGGPIVPSTVLAKRSCFDKVGVFDAKLRKAQDTDMWLRIVSRFEIHHIPEPLVNRRFHSSSLSSDHDKKRVYMLMVTSKMVKLFPELKPLERKRIAMLDRQSAKHKLLKGQRRSAIRRYLSSFINDPFNVKAYFELLIYFLPVPYKRFKISIKNKN